MSDALTNVGQVLHNQRRREAERAVREAAGESFWTEHFPQEARVQILHFLSHNGRHGVALATEAQRLILVDEGWLSLMNQGANSYHDFNAYLLQCPDDMMPTVIEALAEAASRDLPDDHSMGTGFHAFRVEQSFTDTVNTILRRHRISFELIEKQMVEMNSMELHTEVVAPVLRLLPTSTGHGPEPRTRTGQPSPNSLRTMRPTRSPTPERPYRRPCRLLEPTGMPSVR